MTNLSYIYSVLLLLTISFSSCGENQSVQAPDVSDINGDFELIRFDKLLSSTDTLAMIDSMESWSERYPNFYEIYINHVLGIPATQMSTDELGSILSGFVSDTSVQNISEHIILEFGDFSAQKKEFTKAFQYMSYYFEGFEPPTIYTCNSEYSVQRFLFESKPGKDGLGIALDLFLGADYPYRDFVPDQAVFSDYLVRSYNKEHLVKRCMEAILEDDMGVNPGGKLIDQMIYHGKKIYILDHLLPYVSDTVIMEYTPDQLVWCQDNELEIWAFLLKNDLFYSNDINKIGKLVNPSPNSPGMPPQSPGRTANYIGWKVVEAFMKKNPEMSFTELIAYQDAQKILEISRFKPKRK